MNNTVFKSLFTLACRAVKRRVKIENFSIAWTSSVSVRWFSAGTSWHPSTAEKHDFEYDVIISGGGMVGSAMAAALGSANVFCDSKILLLEAGPCKAYTSSLPQQYGNRVCTLTQGTRELLDSFGAWELICNMRRKAIRKMQVWESCSDALLTFDNKNMTEDLAYIVENNVILTAIMQKLSQLQERLSNVEVLYNAKVQHFDFPKPEEQKHFEKPLVTVHLDDGRRIKTRLVIGADGINSLVRKTVNVRYISWEYDQMGLVATLHFAEETENNVAWQRFLPSGPIALLPLTGSSSSLVWTLPPETAKKLVNQSSEEFVDTLNAALWDDSHKDEVVRSALSRLNDVISFVKPGGSSFRQLPPHIVGIDEDSRAAFPLGLGYAVNYIAPRVALIGDAAHRVHPLAGQGVNLGFGDVACLRDTLVTAKYDGCDIGDLSHLKDYERSRHIRVAPSMAVTDMLNRLYCTDLTPVVLLRSLGLQVTDAVKPVKDWIVSQGSRAV